MNFPDANLAVAVRSALGLAEGTIDETYTFQEAVRLLARAVLSINDVH